MDKIRRYKLPTNVWETVSGLAEESSLLLLNDEEWKQNEYKRRLTNYLLRQSDDVPIMKHYQDYQYFYKTRHDIVHAIVCADWGLGFGEEPVEKTLERKAPKILAILKEQVDNKYILRQTPDIILMDDDHIRIVDVAVGADVNLRRKSKIGSYNQLKVSIEAAYKTIDRSVSVSIIPLIFRDVNPSADEYREMISERARLLIVGVLNDAAEVIDWVHSTSDGVRYIELRREDVDATPIFLPAMGIAEDIEPDWLRIERPDWFKPKMTKKDEDFMDALAQFAVREVDNVGEKSDPMTSWNKVLDKWKETSSSSLNPDARPSKELLFDHTAISVDPSNRYPVITCATVTGSVNRELYYAVQDSIMKAGEESSQREIIPKGELAPPAHFDYQTRSCRLKEFLRKNRFRLASKGPFRKALMSLEPTRINPELQELRRQATYESLKRKDLSLDPTDLEHKNHILSLLDLLGSEAHENVLSNPLDTVFGFGGNDGPSRVLSGLRLPCMTIASCTKFQWGQHAFICQMIFREYSRSINRLNKVRRSRFTFTKVPGLNVFILIYPGGELRAEANPSFYHLIHPMPKTDKYDPYTPSMELLGIDGNGTPWGITNCRSVDVFRLETLSMAFDKVLLASLAHFEAGSDLHKLGYDLFESYLIDCDYPRLELLLLVEGKLTTATSLSASRYIFMNTISYNRDISKSIPKCEQPIRSRLHAYCIYRLIAFTVKMSKIPQGRFAQIKELRPTSIDDLFNIGHDIKVRIPPMFSRHRSGKINLKTAISEIYSHMLYHKDRANPTHDQRNILNKILECQIRYDKCRSSSATHTGVDHGLDRSKTDIEYAIDMLTSMKSVDFLYSGRAITIGSKLQRCQKENHERSIDPYTRLKNHQSINFNFTDIPGFKASVPHFVQKTGSASNPQIRSSVRKRRNSKEPSKDQRVDRN